MMNQVSKFNEGNVGILYTLMLIAHTRRNYALFRGHAISMSKELYGLGQEESERFVSALIKAFEEHNLAEHENTPENEREQHWENAKKELVNYFTILAKAFERYGINIDPEELAVNEIDWWQNHNIKDYKKTSEGLATKYQLLYKLSSEATKRIAFAEIKLTESYDHAKKEDDKQLWIETKVLAITCFGVLQEELMKKCPGD